MTLLSNDEAVDLIITVMANLAIHPIKTAETFRNAVLGEGYIAVNPLFGIEAEAEVLPLRDAMIEAVHEGRMIDFGYLPNDVIIEESMRSRDMFEAGEFTHPYDEWLAIARWEGGMNGYMIRHPKDRIDVVELYGVTIPGQPPVILIYDSVSIQPAPGDTMISAARFIRGEVTEESTRARAANSLDPLVTFLRLLADASIPVIHKPAPDRLNKARAKVGKKPIPSYHVVETKDYVSMFQSAKQAKPAAKGGHHASPRAHWRRSHKRRLTSGRIVTVKSSRVNWREPEELHRLFYKMSGDVRSNQLRGKT